MDGEKLAAITIRIRTAGPEALRKIVAELTELTNYQGRMVYHPGLTLSGQEQAKILLGEALQKLYEDDFAFSSRQLNFPFANDAKAAQRALAVIWAEISEIVKENPRIVLNRKIEVLNTALRARFDRELKEIFGKKGQEARNRQLFYQTLEKLPVGIQNIFLLKLLELVETVRGPHEARGWDEIGGGKKKQKADQYLEERIPQVIKKLPVEQFAALPAAKSEPAAVAMFFMFREGTDELDGSKFTYIFPLARRHPNPADLVKEYLSLGWEQRRNLFSIKRGDAWILYDDQKVMDAIGAGQVLDFHDIIRLRHTIALS
jgi:hypothetical protein